MKSLTRLFLVASLFSVAPLSGREAVTAEILEIKKIWDAGGHNAFTDLIRWHERCGRVPT